MILFAWISSGFWTAIAGFFLLLRGRDRFAASQQAVQPLAEGVRTAIVMPICNEDVGRVFAGPARPRANRSCERARPATSTSSS